VAELNKEDRTNDQTTLEGGEGGSGDETRAKQVITTSLPHRVTPALVTPLQTQKC